MKLVIVESPTKAKTIAKFLGSDYKIESSFGHIRDLPKSKIGIDTENNFTPTYIIPTKARKNVTQLKKLAQKAEKIILASDEDREGEAIAWHLTEALGLDQKKTERIVFHEITKEAISEAIKHPRGLNIDLVNAQQARRVLDRLVGYELSPFLWKKVAKGLSAGRVQSVAVRLVVEREREINAFKKDEYWTIAAELESEGKGLVSARLNKINGKTIEPLQIKTGAEAETIRKELEKSAYAVANIKKTEARASAPKPFTTSTLQQTANRWLGWSAKQTMVVAQKLYEEGLITYMRTDSLNLSEKFIDEARAYLEESLGKKYALAEARRFKTKSKNAQEAHEAIRPTEAIKNPAMAGITDNNKARLYKLIWERAIASQMPDAILNNTTIDISAVKTPYELRATGQMIKFDGYLKIYPEKRKEVDLPTIKEKEELALKKCEAEQHFTKPPARYSDAGLVKALEAYGIGRPSTYAPTIATIEARNYVSRDEAKRLKPNDIALVVNDLLVAHFQEIVNYEFTAKIEKDLDEIAGGRKKWQPVIKEFYLPFHSLLEKKYNEIKKEDIMPVEETKEICDKCGAKMIVKTGRYGKFLACSAFPECRNIRSVDGKDRNGVDNEKMKELENKYADEVCDKCGTKMAVKSGRFGLFLACSAYPKCKNIKNIKEGNSGTGIKCPACGEGEIVAKKGRRGVFYSCNRYPDCKNAYWSKPTGEKCPECESLMVHGKEEKIVCSNKACGYAKEMKDI